MHARSHGSSLISAEERVEELTACHVSKGSNSSAPWTQRRLNKTPF